MKEHYKYDDLKFNEIKRQSLKNSIPTMILATCVGLAIPYLSNNGNSLSLVPFLVLVFLISFSLFFGIRKGLKRQEELFNSFEISITENEIIRVQYNTPEIRIQLKEIQTIQKNKKNELSIKSINPKEIIFIQPYIKNQEKLEESLSMISQIESSEGKSFIENNGQIISVIIVALMFTIFVATNKIIVSISGFIFLTIFGYIIKELFTNKNIDGETKKAAKWTIFVFFAVLMNIIFKLLA